MCKSLCMYVCLHRMRCFTRHFHYFFHFIGFYFGRICFFLLWFSTVRSLLTNLFIAIVYFVFVINFSLNNFLLFFFVCLEQGNLPVALIFDYPENSIQEDDIKQLSQKFGVYIVVRQKSRQSTLCIVIKGVEKYVGKLIKFKTITRHNKNKKIYKNFR